MSSTVPSSPSGGVDGTESGGGGGGGGGFGVPDLELPLASRGSVAMIMELKVDNPDRGSGGTT
jgi:hypothetical protein